jgi:hypothetical protein
VAGVVFYGASLVGAGVVEDKFVGAGVEGAGVTVVGVEGAGVLGAIAVKKWSNGRHCCWCIRECSRCGGGWC